MDLSAFLEDSLLTVSPRLAVPILTASAATSAAAVLAALIAAAASALSEL